MRLRSGFSSAWIMKRGSSLACWRRGVVQLPANSIHDGHVCEPLEDMSHGWLIPFFTLYLLSQRRKELRASAGAPSWAGVAWSVFFLALAWFGGLGGQSRIEQVSLIGLIWAVPFAFWGRGVERQMRLPAAYCFLRAGLIVWDFSRYTCASLVRSGYGILNGVARDPADGPAIYSKFRALSLISMWPILQRHQVISRDGPDRSYAFSTQKQRGECCCWLSSRSRWSATWRA